MGFVYVNKWVLIFVFGGNLFVVYLFKNENLNIRL